MDPGLSVDGKDSAYMTNFEATNKKFRGNVSPAKSSDDFLRSSIVSFSFSFPDLAVVLQ